MTPEPFFTTTDLHTGMTVAAVIHNDIWTITKNEESLLIPAQIALDFAAEMIRAVLDECKVTNCLGVTLDDWLSMDEADELRHLLSKITGPEPPNFTTPHGWPRGD